MKKEIKHTPGPWTLCSTSSDVQGNTYIRILSKENEIEANYNLIAAAPELLEALENIKDTLLDNDVTLKHESTHYLVSILLDAEAVIAKAKGEKG